MLAPNAASLARQYPPSLPPHECCCGSNLRKIYSSDHAPKHHYMRSQTHHCAQGMMLGMVVWKGCEKRPSAGLHR